MFDCDLLGCLGLLGGSRCLSGLLGLRGSVTRRLGLGRGPEGLVRTVSVMTLEEQISRNAYEVVTEELHDEGRVLVALLAEGVELGNGVVEGSLGEVASLVGRVQDLVVEDREVQSESETDGVSRGEVSLGNLGGVLVSLERLVGGGLALVTEGELGEVTVVVTLPVRRISIATGQDRCSVVRTSCGRRPWTRRSGQRG